MQKLTGWQTTAIVVASILGVAVIVDAVPKPTLFRLAFDDGEALNVLRITDGGQLLALTAPAAGSVQSVIGVDGGQPVPISGTVNIAASDGGTAYVRPFQLAKTTGASCVGLTVHAADAGTMLLPEGFVTCKATTDLEGLAFNVGVTAASEPLMRGQSVLYYNSQPDAGYVSASLAAGAASVTNGVRCCNRTLVAP